MYRIALLATIALLQATSAASAERIKRPPPDDTELARLASDQVMNDDLRKGDIIATDHGFLQFRGLKADGSSDFVPIANPLSAGKPAPGNFR